MNSRAAGTRAVRASTTGPKGPFWPVTVALVRLPLVALAAALTVGLFRVLGSPISLPPSPLVSSLYLLPVNIVSLLLLRWLLRREGRTLRELLGFDRSRLGRDVAWGLLWVAVLYLPFAATILGSMLLLYGGDAFTSFEAVFAPAVDSTPALGFVPMLVIAIIAVVTFAPINAPTEELVYRAYAQGGLEASTGRVIAVVLPAAAFGLQHLFFAPTVPAMLVFGLAFFVWGLGSGLIYLRQRRLMPLVVSHFIVNLLTSAPALAIPFFIEQN